MVPTGVGEACPARGGLAAASRSADHRGRDDPGTTEYEEDGQQDTDPVLRGIRGHIQPTSITAMTAMMTIPCRLPRR